MTTYIKEIKRQLRDKYKFMPSGGTSDDPIFENIPDGVYPMEINNRLDHVKVDNGKISCCNFNKNE